MYLNNNLGKPEENWKQSTILAKLIPFCVLTDQIYAVPIKLVLEALIKGNKSKHHKTLQHVTEVRDLFREFAPFLKTLTDVHLVENLENKMKRQVTTDIDLNAVQYATVLFYQSKWIKKKPATVIHNFSKVIKDIQKIKKDNSS
ncbi:MAG: hypothetical protein Q8P11_02165 [bacterium]|nr:hypothetical protein [bacterium]